MARLIYSARALADFLRDEAPAAALKTVDIIIEAVKILGNHPLIGRPIEHDLRELIISRGKTGYVALYSYEEAQDVVLILALRHQREAGYVLE